MKVRKPSLPVDQLDKYRTSVHAKLLAKGETRVAQCASCHGAHGVREVNDAKSPVYAANVPATCGHCHADAEYMSDFDIKTNQYDEYVQSVHGKALLEKNDVRGAPACNDCHGNHGAAPPSIDAISHICGSCHSYNAELFLGSPLAPAFKEKSLADCVACHGKHLITHVSEEWLGDEPGATCRKCHEEGEEGSDLAVYFTDTFGSVRQSFEEIEQLLAEGDMKGMDVTEGEDYVEAARQGLMQARTLVHSFSRSAVEEKVMEISANQAAALVGSLVLEVRGGRESHGNLSESSGRFGSGIRGPPRFRGPPPRARDQHDLASPSHARRRNQDSHATSVWLAAADERVAACASLGVGFVVGDVLVTAHAVCAVGPHLGFVNVVACRAFGVTRAPRLVRNPM
jgi:hypothetical protein